MNNLESFVKNQNIPEYVKNNHELFETFVGAYYEWLELQNDSENNNNLDVYKAVGNPGYINANQEKVVDIDESLDEFIDYFANEVVPISLDAIQTNPRFFLKKIRDLYLAKGTTKSFKLFFKLYYNDNIDVFETSDTILRASDGKYFAFPTAHFQVTGLETYLEQIDFTLAELLDSDENVIGSILDGGVVDRSGGTKTIIKVQFATSLELTENTTYYIKNVDNDYRIKLSPLVSLSEVTMTYGGSLYDENDPVYFESSNLSKRFLGSVRSVGKGTVEGVKVRNRGLYYTPNDYFYFYEGPVEAGNLKVTKTGNTGDITEINDIELRTGTENTGYLAGILEDVFLPVNNAGDWKTLPQIQYKSSTDFNALSTGDPYLKSNNTGLGFQIIPVSKLIGKAQNISVDQETYFLDSDDVVINTPMSVIVENNNLTKGDKVAFQYFGNHANYHPFRDDSDSIIIGINYTKEFITDAGSTDSEVNRIINIAFPYAYDSETFGWKYKNIELDSRTPSADFWKPFINFLDSEGNINYRIIKQVSYKQEVIDGGNGLNTITDSEIDGGTAFVDLGDSDSIDGGAFEFSSATVEYLQIEYQGAFLSSLEETHLNKIQTIDSDILQFNVLNVKEEPRILDNNEDSDVGEWVDTGHYGEVVNVNSNNNVIKIVSLNNSDLPETKELEDLSADKYNIIKLSKLKEGVSVKDHSLPLNNVVHQVDRIKVNYKTSVVSDIIKKFYNQDGFISSDYGGTIQDNYYYSDWSYRIRTQLPMQSWKEKFKTMLHPAGMVLTSDYSANTTAVVGNGNVYISEPKKPSNVLTFDMQQEYIDLTVANKGITTDGIYYKSNAFEALNLLRGEATALDASSLSGITNLAFKQQSGNAFWDYEPIGYVKNTIDSEIGSYYSHLKDQYLNWDSDQLSNKYTTQEDDGNGKVKNTYAHFQFFDGSAQDRYKNQSRYPKILTQDLMISKTQFEDIGFVEHTVFDSDLPNDFFADFNDSESGFRSIDYSRLKSDSDNRYFQLYKIPRLSEIASYKEKDLHLAMKENGSLVFDDNGTIYTDYEAYERKWNQVNNRRTRNNEGYSIKGYMQLAAFEHIEQRSKKRNKDYVDSLSGILYSTSHATPSNEVVDPESIVWSRSYYDQINKHIIDKDYEKETYRDPSVSMRGRRRGR